IPPLFLADGQYGVTVLLWMDTYRLICQQDEVVKFEVTDAGEVRGDYLGGMSGAVRPLLQWRCEWVEGGP
ncbi:MAG: hypothetical protein M1531_03065, partial [Chloroflexi bacterium]|nr:hypothetical protein [Chloroflexota bacterium]